MVFIMNEKKFCKDILDGIADNRIINGISLNYITLLFAKYYIIYGGIDKDYVNIISSVTNMSYYKTFDLFDKYVNKNKKDEIKIREKERIVITANELEYIGRISDRNVRKFYCTLLVLSRFYDSVWINVSYSELFKLANLNSSKEERCRIIKQLVNLNYISMNHYDNDISIKINDIELSENNGKFNKDMIITEISDIGKKYIVATENKIMCQICGRLVEKRISRKYCKPCSKKQKSIKTYNAFLKKKTEQENK